MGGSGVNWDAPLAAFAPLQVSLLAEYCPASKAFFSQLVAMLPRRCAVLLLDQAELHAASRGMF